MSAQPTPEIQRTPLEALLLQIKSTRPTADVRDYLGRALDPPDVKAIESAWATLGMLGAIQDTGQDQAGLSARLTPLGSHLAMIPVDVRLAKVSTTATNVGLATADHVVPQMLVLAAIFRCLDPVSRLTRPTISLDFLTHCYAQILTVVALMSSKPFFLNPMEQRDEAKKYGLAHNSLESLQLTSTGPQGSSDVLYRTLRPADGCNCVRGLYGGPQGRGEQFPNIRR